MRKKYWMLLLIMAALTFSGCSMHAVQELYCLPMRSEAYANLQAMISKSMAGFEYSAPLTGDNQQTVQAADLDGDGQPEYILFAKNNSKKTLNIFVFAGNGETYELVDTISSAGSAFDRVEYIQMDDQPGVELVVGRQVSNQVVRSVSVYSMASGQMEQVMSTGYAEFITCDMDNDQQIELFVLGPGNGTKGIGMLYQMENGTVERSKEVNLSESTDNIKRIMVSKLQGGMPAIYVASAVTDSSGIITDVYAVVGGELTNVSFSNESGTSVQTMRNYYVYADDIDKDGVLELPSLIPTKNPQDQVGSDSQYVIRWYALTEDGSEVDKMYTYHNYAGKWYIRLDANLAERIFVTNKGSSYEFSLWNEEQTEYKSLMTVYALTGQKREEQAVADNRFVLYRSETVIYAANLSIAYAELGMTKEALTQSFGLILEDWKTGER